MCKALAVARSVGARIAGDRPQCGLLHALAAAVVLLAGSAFADELPVRDPTRPPFAGKQPVRSGQSDSLLLVSTSVSDGRGSAVINEEVVTVGSRIGGALVTAIEPGRVTLRRGAEMIVLQLFTPPVKRPARESP